MGGKIHIFFNFLIIFDPKNVAAEYCGETGRIARVIKVQRSRILHTTIVCKNFKGALLKTTFLKRDAVIYQKMLDGSGSGFTCRVSCLQLC